jgi:hypothetical protein
VKGALGNLVRSIFSSKWQLVNIKPAYLTIRVGLKVFLNNTFLSHNPISCYTISCKTRSISYMPYNHVKQGWCSVNMYQYENTFLEITFLEIY